MPADLAGPLDLALGSPDIAPIGAQVIFFRSRRPRTTSPSGSRITVSRRDVVIADQQTAGRGRGSHTWHSPAGSGLYVSVVVRVDATAAGVNKGAADWPRWLTLATGVALAEGLHAASGLPVSIKWPNDLVIAPAAPYAARESSAASSQKAAADGGRLTHVVVGFGVNVRSSAFPPEISARATSLEDELGRDVDRGAVLAAMLRRFSTWLARLRAQRSADVARDGRRSPWRDRVDGGVAGRWRTTSRRHRRDRRRGRLAHTRRDVDRARRGRRGDLAVTPDAYCREIEAYLTRKNDGHLIRIVGPSFARVCGWAEQGVPLKIAYAGIDRYFERYYAKGPRRRPVHVDHCEHDVLDMFDDWRRAVGVTARRPRNLEPRPRESLATRLERAMARLTALRAGARLQCPPICWTASSASWIRC
jgi:biotin-[acetyl-CoA-carboxylase] ligase BirA-like protein